MNMTFNDHTAEFDRSDIEQNRIYGALAYLWILFFIPLVVAPASKFGRFHANQGLLLLIFTVVLNTALAIVRSILSIIFLGFIGSILVSLANLLSFIAVIFGLVNTLNGKAVELPFIGGIRLIK